MSDIFETPIFVTSIFHKFVEDIDLKELSSIVLKYKEENKNCSRSGRSSFQTDYFNTYLSLTFYQCQIILLNLSGTTIEHTVKQNIGTM
jgi:uncharacterized beta-barrel protein YwiB (DUF1934 family)